MSKVNAFFKRKDIEVSLKRYGIAVSYTHLTLPTN